MDTYIIPMNMLQRLSQFFWNEEVSSLQSVAISCCTPWYTRRHIAHLLKVKTSVFLLPPICLHLTIRFDQHVVLFLVDEQLQRPARYNTVGFSGQCLKLCLLNAFSFKKQELSPQEGFEDRCLV